MLFGVELDWFGYLFDWQGAVDYGDAFLRGVEIDFFEASGARGLYSVIT
jgi:hypothetical protein